MARKALYAKTLTQLRALMIARMAKPEEVGGVVFFVVMFVGIASVWGVQAAALGLHDAAVGVDQHPQCSSTP